MESFDAHLREFKSLHYEEMRDEDIFWVMVYVTFYSGMRASTVSERLPAIKKYLADFRKVKHYSQEAIDKIMKAPDIIRHPKKIEACVFNAKEFDNLLKEHHSFKDYIESFGSSADESTIDRLRMDLRSRFQYLGQRTVNHFLTDLGLNVLKPDRVICRIFSRLGLIDDKNNITQAIEVGRKIATATGYPIRYIDIIFVKYGQMGKDNDFGLTDGVCLEKKPRCHICQIRQNCRYHAMGRI